MADEMAEWPPPWKWPEYTMIHASKHESRPAARADFPIRALNERAAIAHVRAEVERIRGAAPSNVEHRVTLMHEGRAVYVAGPFRGVAPAVS